MADRRVDRIERCLRGMMGRARFQQLLEVVRAEEGNQELSYQSVYIAIQMENQRLEQEGRRTKFVTSREGEKWGWVRLQEQNDAARSDAENQVEALINERNASVGEEIRAWLQRMDWRTFESTFLTKVLEALGFQDAKITQATRDGGADALVSYRRGIVSGRALIQAKHWKVRPVSVDEVQKLRG
jgi:restriction endonuclease Mrr